MPTNCKGNLGERQSAGAAGSRLEALVTVSRLVGPGFILQADATGPIHVLSGGERIDPRPLFTMRTDDGLTRLRLLDQEHEQAQWFEALEALGEAT